MRVTVDTNVLVRAAVRDDLQQAAAAARLLREAELTVITLPTLCEFVWVTTRAYRRGAGTVADAIRRLIDNPAVRVDRRATGHGLAMMVAGGDFADGVIAYEGRRLGGEVFASFDRNAVALVAAQGGAVELLAADP